MLYGNAGLAAEYPIKPADKTCRLIDEKNPLPVGSGLSVMRRKSVAIYAYWASAPRIFFIALASI